MVKRVFGGRKVMFCWRKEVFRVEQVCFGGEKSCRGYNGVFGVQMECFEVFG